MRPALRPPQLARDLADLLAVVLDEGCAGCGAPAARSGLCEACTGLLIAPAEPAWPDPVPAWMPEPWAVAAYDGAVREAVLAYKEHGRLLLRRPLAAAVAAGVREVMAQRSAGQTGPRGGGRPGLALVPVPSRRSAVRSRGHDPTLGLARQAALQLRRQGWDVRAVPALRMARRVADQVGLTAGERAANLARAHALRRGAPRLLAAGDVVVVDDVVTTGASLAEATRALAEGGVQVLGAAVVAATARRHPTAD